MIKIAPSILSADFSNLLAEVERVEKAGADYLHIDVMDGHFVPQITLGPLVVQSLRKKSRLVFDVHLMIDNPGTYVDNFAAAGADIITVHVEACTHLHRVMNHIKTRGVKAGVAINPATPPQLIEYVLPLADLVLIMTVNPGFGGQAFIHEMIPKIKIIKDMVSSSGSRAEIEVDGGINAKTAPLAAGAGAEILVAGSAVFSSDDPAEAIRLIKQKAAGGD